MKIFFKIPFIYKNKFSYMHKRFKKKKYIFKGKDRKKKQQRNNRHERVESLRIPIHKVSQKLSKPNRKSREIEHMPNTTTKQVLIFI